MDYESRSQYEFVVTYKGDAADLAAVDGMEYGFESSARSTKRSFDGPPSPGQKQFTIEQRLQLGGPIERGDETITAEVTWNGRTETIQLQPVP
ncbi:hypothetical protein ACVNS2_02865 [Paenibacillus caseinilyticus]|uniref:Uncharacterized protein n=1 Tax=Paenibacillus mucilaginosus K02 TaxID=997761 RepID=I0BB91_9BACL|nr:hypothetical protein [Paenibacillus mucilaginosus]AFH59638.1 hypothetical protein B2K_02665 [Paenibacillus mucilaginosus K02]